MAPKTKEKSRKAGTTTTTKVEKSIVEAPTTTKKTRKRAADMFEDPIEEPVVEKASKKVKTITDEAKPKKSKSKTATKELETPAEAMEEVIEKAKQEITKKDKKSKKANATATETPTTRDETKSTVKSKKRKAPEEKQEKVTEPSTKKTKKDKTTTQKIKDTVKSGVEAASNGLETALETAGEIVGGKSIADDIEEVADATNKSKKGKKSKAKNQDKPVEDGFEAFEEDGDEVDDDQTAALLQGFDDSDDEATGDVGFESGKPVPKIEKSKQLSKKLKKATETRDDEPGVVYVGRIPHGFHEHEMREYFTQFGTVDHVRLSRSKKTGNSKHYAFLQFASSEVAKIVADTMNNYLLFGHILKCSVIPKERVHENLWIGADKRFKSIPWNKIEGRKLDLAKGRSEWSKKVDNESKKRDKKLKTLEKIGYTFEAPKLKDVESVPIKSVVVTNGENGITVAEETIQKKKGKKGKTEEAPLEVEASKNAEVVVGDESSAVAPKKKSKRSKKSSA